MTSTDFGGSVMENWQSEFLQFSLFILATIWLVQKGSNESKVLEDAGLETKKQQQIGRNAPATPPRWAKCDDWRTRIYENSLLLAMTAIFFATWFAQSLNNWREFNDEARQHGGQPSLGRLPRQRGLLGEDAGELAIRVPRRRDDGRVHDLPAPARLAGVEAGRRPARRDRLVRIGRVPGTVPRTCPSRTLAVPLSPPARTALRLAATRSSPSAGVDRDQARGDGGGRGGKVGPRRGVAADVRVPLRRNERRELRDLGCELGELERDRHDPLHVLRPSARP